MRRGVGRELEGYSERIQDWRSWLLRINYARVSSLYHGAGGSELASMNIEEHVGKHASVVSVMAHY